MTTSACVPISTGCWSTAELERVNAICRHDLWRDSVREIARLERDRLALVLGTEGDGLDPETIARCDYTVCIPMQHGVDSLNVAAASAVAFWQLRGR